MARLNDPHLQLRNVIHIAGTNGKGSTLSYINQALQDAGFRVHATTSPHLISICERIQIASQQITPDDFLATLEEIRSLGQDLPLTYFEWITAVAYLSFSRQPADYILVETGLGGRYDATNVIPHPLVSIITSISLDHMHMLGSTVEQIASEKAGIIKANTPVITCPQAPEVLVVLKAEAERKHSDFILATPQHPYNLYLSGKHQQTNAAVAEVAIKRVADIPHDQVLQSLSRTRWPGRLQHFHCNNTDYWLDIAHNIDGVSAILNFFEKQRIQNFSIAFSLKSDRDPIAYLKPFLGKAISISYIEQAPYANCHDATTIQNAANTLGIKIFQDELACFINNPPSLKILITGSAVLVGQALEILDNV